MATTSAGNPYVEASDLVANYPATSLALANRLDKYAINPFADATARDAAIPTPVQGQLAQTLDDNKVWRYDGTAWAPFSGAAGAANFTDTPTGTYSDAGINYKYLTLTGTGTVTFDTAGTCSVLLLSGGGGGGYGETNFGGGGGGGGGQIFVTSVLVPENTIVVSIGAGGPSGYTGNLSSLEIDGPGVVVYAPGGGSGGQTVFGTNNGGTGASGGGARYTGAGGSGTSPFGFAGGAGNGGTTGGPGGGAGGASVGATPGVGASNSITGTAVTRAAGGAGGLRAAVGAAGAANTGNGGGANNSGGSGVVIVRVVV